MRERNGGLWLCPSTHGEIEACCLAWPAAVALSAARLPESCEKLPHNSLAHADLPPPAHRTYCRLCRAPVLPRHPAQSEIESLAQLDQALSGQKPLLMGAQSVMWQAAQTYMLAACSNGRRLHMRWVDLTALSLMVHSQRTAWSLDILTLINPLASKKRRSSLEKGHFIPSLPCCSAAWLPAHEFSAFANAAHVGMTTTSLAGPHTSQTMLSVFKAESSGHKYSRSPCKGCL